MVFGGDTAIQRSSSRREQESSSLSPPVVQPTAEPNQNHFHHQHHHHHQHHNHYATPTTRSSAAPQANQATENHNYQKQDKDSGTVNTDKPETHTKDAFSTTSNTQQQQQQQQQQQPVFIPRLPFTLGPYPVPLGGLPHIKEETHSTCSDLSKHPSICSQRTLPRKHPQSYPRRDVPKLGSGSSSSSSSSSSGDEKQNNQEENVNDDDHNGTANSPKNGCATASQGTTMSALGMGSFHQDHSHESSSFYTRTGAPDSQFRHYNVDVDPTQEDRGADIPLFSLARPHMRGFHFAWMSFFVAFFTWFAMTPLLAEIARSLDFTRQEIFLSSVLAVLSSGFARIVIGPLNEAYGPRWVMACTLVAAAIPTALAGWLLRSTTSLYLLRFCIGIAGSSFVTCQYWTLSMFTHEIAGTANALAAGWGNLGGGAAQVFMGSVFFPMAKLAYGGGSCFGSCAALKRNRGQNDDDDLENLEYDRASDLAWRTILLFPAVLSLVTAYCVIRYSDDTPKGSIQRRHRQEQRSSQQIKYAPILLTIWENLKAGSRNWNTFLLAFQYGCCFGVEITMTQAAAWYFMDEFGQTTESAAAIASAFGWMNLFARGIGGYGSDLANDRFGLRGRLVCLIVLLATEGCLVIVFGFASTLGGAISVMVVFSIFVQAAEGAVYGVVPYVDKSVVGSIAGLVGAGGNIGGACFSFLFACFTYRTAFLSMGIAAVVSSFVSALICIPGHKGLIAGSDSDEILKRRRKTKPPMIILIPITHHTYLHTVDATASFEMDIEGDSHAT
uniref:Nitrate/nitrite transporter n=1 Tax=Amphora coffeiformis TaxID=265554 RepID=A0A7S3L298_9STRA